MPALVVWRRMPFTTVHTGLSTVTFIVATALSLAGSSIFVRGVRGTFRVLAPCGTAFDCLGQFISSVELLQIFDQAFGVVKALRTSSLAKHCYVPVDLLGTVENVHNFVFGKSVWRILVVAVREVREVAIHFLEAIKEDFRVAVLDVEIIPHVGLLSTSRNFPLVAEYFPCNIIQNLA